MLSFSPVNLHSHREYIQSRSLRSHPAVLILLNPESGDWPAKGTGREGSLEAAPDDTHRKCSHTFGTQTCRIRGIKIWGYHGIILLWVQASRSKRSKREIQTGSCYLHTERERNTSQSAWFKSCEVCLQVSDLPVCWVCSQTRPLFWWRRSESLQGQREKRSSVLHPFVHPRCLTDRRLPRWAERRKKDEASTQSSS